MSDAQEPLGHEAAALAPWSDDEKRDFTAHCFETYRKGPESVEPYVSVDWLRKRRGLPEIVRPAPEPMRWKLGEYGGRKSAADFEDESRTLDSNSFQGVERPGSRNLNGRGA